MPLLIAETVQDCRLSGAILTAACLLICSGHPAAAAPTQANAAGAVSIAPDRGTPISDQQQAETPATAAGDWGGVRTRLEDKGVSIGGSLMLESFSDLDGGFRRKTVGASTVDLNVSLDLEKLLGLSGGEFYTDFENHAGRDPEEIIGDLQVTDKFNATPYTQIFEFWYQQKLFDDQLRIKVGKIDGNSEFSVIDNGLNFLSASTQVTPTLLSFTTTPDPSPALDIFYTPKNSIFYAAFSVADANRHDNFLDFAGKPSHIIQSTENGALLIGETGLVWDKIASFAGDGNLRLGIWKHTGTFTRFDGTPQDGASGFYAILDQTLWRPMANSKDQRGIGAFLEYGETDPTVSTIDRHYGGGLSWTGPFSARPEDATGISVEYAHISKEAGLPDDHEVLLEAFYQVHLHDWLTLQPDLQYIVNPGGEFDNALVGILNLTIAL